VVAVTAADFAEWNAGIKRARREYQRNPFSDRRLGKTGPNFALRAGVGCPITCWDARPAGLHARKSFDSIVVIARRCGEPMVLGEPFCERHLADKRRLS